MWKNRIHNFIFRWLRPRMLYGVRNNGRYLRNTRISTSTFIAHPANLMLGDRVYIGHHNFIEASNGITIGEGCQITNFVTITTHSSHQSIRLYGPHYQSAGQHTGYVTGPVYIGAYTFIGPYSLLMPGTIVGKGSLIKAGSYLKGEYPDFSIISGNPATVTGDTRDLDRPLLEENPELANFYRQWANDQE